MLDGRSYTARVYADTADELEIAALHEAGGFFGPGVHLAVCQDYDVLRACHPDATGTYLAHIRVQELVPERDT